MPEIPECSASRMGGCSVSKTGECGVSIMWNLAGSDWDWFLYHRKHTSLNWSIHGSVEVSGEDGYPGYVVSA
jgi:hypothetical protein